MKIRQTTPNDLDAVMETYSVANQFMFENDNKTQWENKYPPLSMIIRDIEDGASFVCVDGSDNVLGVFFTPLCQNRHTYISRVNGLMKNHME